jgi:hypothetical protein
LNSVAASLPSRFLTDNVCEGIESLPGEPKNVRLDGLTAKGPVPDAGPTLKSTVTNPPIRFESPMIVTWLEYRPGPSLEASAESFRMAGIFPVVGVTDSQSLPVPRYRIEASYGSCVDAAIVTLWTAGLVDPAGAARVTCCGTTVNPL